MSDLPAVAQSNLPAHLQGVIGKEHYDELSGGVTSGFPVISYKGKVWRVKKGGESQAHVNEHGEALPSIDVVILRSHDKLSKTYYEGAYTEGDQSKPDCWSSDGVRPDAGVPKPVNDLCAVCPKNQWGSKQTDDGRPARACQDVRRVAVAMSHQIEDVAAGKRELDDVDVLLLRVPPASLNPLKDYALKVLKPKGIPYHVLVTKVGFDNDVAYPKFTFKGLRFLNEDEFTAVATLREGDEAKRVINESPEYAEAGTTDDEGEVGAATTQVAPETKSSAPAKAKPVPVEETAVEVEAAAAEAETIDEIAAAPPPQSSPQPAASEANPPADEPKAAATSPAADEDFDEMLNSILG